MSDFLGTESIEQNAASSGGSKATTPRRTIRDRVVDRKSTDDVSAGTNSTSSTVQNISVIERWEGNSLDKQYASEVEALADNSGLSPIRLRALLKSGGTFGPYHFRCVVLKQVR